MTFWSQGLIKRFDRLSASGVEQDGSSAADEVQDSEAQGREGLQEDECAGDGKMHAMIVLGVKDVKYTANRDK